MSALAHGPQLPIQPSKPIPILRDGDRMSRSEFERRYTAMPGVKKAELIEGVVHMPSPVLYLKHSDPHGCVTSWLTFYKTITPGVTFGPNGTVRLDMINEHQPDVLHIIRPENGGGIRYSSEGYLEGSPDLVVEIASTSSRIDMNEKKEVYRRNGVKEYVIWNVKTREITWFTLKDANYVPLQLDGDRLYRSEAFPGLVMDPEAMLMDDLQKLCEDQLRQRDSMVHIEFVKRLADAKNQSSTLAH